MCYWPCQVFSSYEPNAQNKRRRSGFTDAVGKHFPVFCSPQLAPKLGERGVPEAEAWRSCLHRAGWCPQDGGGLDEAGATSEDGRQEPGAAAGDPCDARHAFRSTSPQCSDKHVKPSIICPYHDTQPSFGPTRLGALDEYRTGHYLTKQKHGQRYFFPHQSV